MKKKYQSFLNMIAKFLVSENVDYKQNEVIITWLNYILETLIIHLCIMTSSSSYELKFVENSISITVVMVGRVLIAFLYCFSRKKALLILSKLLAMVSILIFRSNLLIAANFAQLMMELLYYGCKQKKRGNFDSRPFLYPSICKVFLIQIAQILTTKTQNSPGRAQLLNLLIISIALYWATTVDYTYRLKTQRRFKVLSMGNVFVVIFTIIMDQTNSYLGMMKYAVLIAFCVALVVSQTWYNVKDYSIIFSLNYEQINTEDKIQYIKSLIDLVEEKEQIAIATFFESQQKLCNKLNQRLRESYNNKIQKSHYLDQMTLYLALILQHARLKNDTIYQISLFYFNKWNVQSLKRFDTFDLSHLRYMNEIKDEIINKKESIKHCHYRESQRKEWLLRKLAKQFTEKYQFFWEYLLERRINLNFCEQMGQQLLKLKEEFLTQNFEIEQNYFHQSTNNLLRVLKEDIMHKDSNDSAHLKTDQSQLVNNETPIIIISAQTGNVGQIVYANPAAAKLTGYTNQQLKERHINILLPIQFDIKHRNILEKAVQKYSTVKEKVFQHQVFIKCKNTYFVFVTLKINFRSSENGSQWIALFRPNNKTPRIITNQLGEIRGVTTEAFHYGFASLSSVNLTIQKNLYQQLLEKKSVLVPQNKNISQEFQLIIPKSCYLKLNTQLSQFSGYNILEIHREQMEEQVKIVYQFGSTVLTGLKLLKGNVDPDPFQFHFNPISLEISNETFQEIEPFKQIIEQIYTKPKIFYGENIKQMIYLDGVLEFRENIILNEEDQYKSHPQFNQKNKNNEPKLKDIDINHFSENIAEINKKFPKQFLIIIILVIIGSAVLISVILASFIMILEMNQINQQSMHLDSLFRLKRFTYLDIGMNAMKKYMMNQRIIDNFDIEKDLKTYVKLLSVIDEQITRTSPPYSNVKYVNLPKSYLGYTNINDMEQDLILLVSKENMSIQQIGQCIYLVLSGLTRASFDIYKQEVNQKIKISIANRAQQLNMIFIIGLAIWVILFVCFHLVIRTIRKNREQMLKVLLAIPGDKIEILLKNSIQTIQMIQTLSNERRNIESILEETQCNHFQKKGQGYLSKKQLKLYLIALFFLIFIVGSFLLFKLSVQKAAAVSGMENIKFLIVGMVRYPKQIWLSLVANQLKIPFSNYKIQNLIKQFYQKYQVTIYEAVQKIKDKQISPEFKQFFKSINKDKTCEIFQLGSRCYTDFDGTMSINMNQIFLKVIMMENDMHLEFLKTNQFNPETALIISEIFDHYILKMYNKNSDVFQEEIKLMIKKSKEINYTVSFCLISVALISSALIVCYIYQQRKYANLGLDILVGILPLNLLLSNPLFKKWYYQKYAQQVY